MKTRITAGRIKKMKAEGQQSFDWDSVTSGFGVRVTESGAKSFIFQGVLHGKSIRITIGNADAWDIDEAREEANRLRVLLDKGIDPRQEKREQDAEHQRQQDEAIRRRITVSEVFAAYMQKQAPGWSARHLRNHQAMVKAGGEPRGRGRRPGDGAFTMPGPLYPLLRLRLADLDAETVERWLEDQKQRGGAQTAQAYRALKTFIAWASEQKAYASVVRSDACLVKAVRAKVPKVGAKADCLEREQLRNWFAEVRKINNPIHAAYLQIMLLTGARREELATLRWQNVDLTWDRMQLHDKVERDGRTIPVTPYVKTLVQTLKTANDLPPAVGMDGRPLDPEWSPSVWVFASPKAKEGRLAEPRIAHVKALRAAGIPHVSIHGLRRSFATLSEWVEMPVGVVAQIMGHKPSATAEKHYKQRPLDLLRMWHAKLEGWILNEAGIAFDASVAPGLKLVSMQRA